MNDATSVTGLIESLAYGGDGLARIEGCVFFVPETAPGDYVRIRVTQQKKRYARGVVEALLTPSPDRCEPCCRIGGVRVPGCVYDHLSYVAEVRIKESQLYGFFRKTPDIDAVFHAFVAAEQPLHYRNKLTVHVEQGKIGYYLEQSHRVLDLESCPLSCEAINAALRTFRREQSLARFEGADVVFRATPQNGVIWWSSTGVQSDNVPDVLIEASPAGPMRVTPKGFYQVNPAMAMQLVETVAQRFCATTTPHDVVDLYCGVGVFGLTCLQCGGRSLQGVEAGYEAVRCARENAIARGLDATFHACELTDSVDRRGHSKKQSDEVTLAQLIRDPTETTVIVDPPRGGMAREIVFSLARSGVARIFYVSCDPSTLHRDVQILQAEGGYRVVFVRGFDLFPRTAHFETVVELRKQ